MKIFYITIVCLIIINLLSACGQADLTIQVVDSVEATAIFNQLETQTPSSNQLLYYEHTQTGIYFHHPADWQVQAMDNTIVVSGDQFQLNIEFVLLMADEMSVQTNVEDDISLHNAGTVNFLGQMYPVILDTSNNRLYYTSPQLADDALDISYQPLIFSNIGIAIYLDALTSPLSDMQRGMTDALVESMGFTWLITSAPEVEIANWIEYQAPISGLSFHYPPDWTVSEIDSTLVISTSEIVLTLAFDGNPSGLAAGEFRKGDPSHVLVNGQLIERIYLVFDDAITQVYYGQPGTYIGNGDSRFTAFVSAPTLDSYELIDLSPHLLRQIDWIMVSLHLM